MTDPRPGTPVPLVLPPDEFEAVKAALPLAAALEDIREPLGRTAHAAYRDWLAEQVQRLRGDSAQMASWEDLTEGMREAYMLIGHAVAVYALTENAVTWGTSCTSCARVLDSSYAETIRRETAERKLAALRDLCDSIAASVPEGEPATVAVSRILAIISSEEEGGDGDDRSFDGPVI